MTAPIEVPKQSPPLVTDDLGNTIRYLLSGSVFHQATVTLTNAQIKTLPTTPVQLVAAPGANRVFVPVRGYLMADCAAGAYTNITAFTSTVGVRLAGGALVLIGPWVDEALGDVRIIHSLLVPYVDPDGSDPTAKLVAAYDISTDNINKALQVRCGNAAGNFTGGHASNTLTVSVLYSVFDTTTGLFL